MTHNSPRTPPAEVAVELSWEATRAQVADSPPGLSIELTVGVVVPVLSIATQQTSRFPALTSAARVAVTLVPEALVPVVWLRTNAPTRPAPPGPVAQPRLQTGRRAGPGSSSR